MNPEVAEYKDMENMLRENLEQQYAYNMFVGNFVDAHENVKSLMEYRLIPKDDPRTNKNTKIFGNEVNTKDPNSWGQFDYRRNPYADFLPRYLFCDLRYYVMFKVNTYAHWGKRVEGNYEGDIKVEANSRTFRMSLVNTSKTVKDAIDEVNGILNANGKNLSNVAELKEMATVGVMRIYKIEVTGNIQTKYRTFGYVMLKMDNSGAMVARAVLKYEAMYNNWIDIKEFVANLENAVNSISQKAMKFNVLTDPTKALERQASMLGTSMAQDKAHEKLVAKEAAQKAANEAAKKSAKQAKDNKSNKAQSNKK